MKAAVKRWLRRAGWDLHRYVPTASPDAQLARVLSAFGIDLVLDVGANTGQYGALLRELGYRGRIMSFEPLGAAHDALSARAAPDPLWNVAPRGAVGDRDGEIVINVAGNSASSSVLPMLAAHSDAAPHSQYVGTEPVALRRLDGLVGDVLPQARSSLLKIDTQGFEAAVLAGAPQTLAAASAVQLELSLVPLYEGQALYDTLIAGHGGPRVRAMGPVARLRPAGGRSPAADGRGIRAARARRRRLMGAAALLAFFLAVVAVTVKRPRAGVVLIVFFSPWLGTDVDFGVTFNAYLLSVLAVVVVTALRSLQPGWRPTRIAAVRLLMAFVLFGLLWSLTQLAVIPLGGLSQGGLRGPISHAIGQLILFPLALAPALLVAWWVRSADDLTTLVRTYLWSVAILAVIGWFQIIVWYGTGNNPLPIGALNHWLGGSTLEVREGTFDFGALAIYRMNSFAGEPRGMGAALVLAMLIIQAIVLTAPRVDARKWGPLWMFFFASTLATYSTLSAFLWAIGTVVEVATPWLLGVRLRRSVGQLLATVLVIVVPIGLAVVAAEARGIPVIDLLSERTVQRIDENGAVEDFDLAIVDYFTAHPADAILGLGLGNAHLYAGDYLLPEFKIYAEGNVFIAKAGYLKTISEIGFVGLLLFVVWYTVLLLDLAAVVRRLGRSPVAAAIPVGITAAALYLAANQFGSQFWCIAGGLAGFVGAMRRTRAAAPPRALAA